MNISNTQLAKKIGLGGASFLLTSLIAYESGSIMARPHVPYRDIGGVLTVCDGITGKDVVEGKRYSDGECDTLLAKFAYTHSIGVLDCITEPVSVYEQVAYSSLAYNVGINAVCGSDTVEMLNAGDHAAGCAGIESFYNVKINGRMVDCRIKSNNCSGIWNRRQQERAICEMRILIPGLFDDVKSTMEDT